MAVIETKSISKGLQDARISLKDKFWDGMIANWTVIYLDFLSLNTIAVHY